MKKKILQFLLLTMFIIIPLSVDAASQCPSNATPTLQATDPACWTSASSGYYETCTWYSAGPGSYWACDGGVQGTSSSVGTHCRPYLTALYSTCGDYGGCSNRTDFGAGSTYTRWVGSTAYTCYYITVRTWSTCSVATGIRYATAIDQRSTPGTSCQNLNQATTQTCGICGTADNVGTENAPTTNLCAFGTATTPTLVSNVWTWTCRGSDNTTSADDSNCSAPRSVDGVCNSTATGIYTIDEIAYRGSLCTSGTPTIAPTPFLTYGETKTWGCNGIGTGISTSATACSATRQRPAASCGSQHGQTTDTLPSSNLCTAPSTASAVTYDTSGHWQWVCTHPSTEADPKTVNCSAPSCLATTPFELQPYVYLNDDDPIHATMTVICPNVCCSINDASDTDITICNGTPGQITVSPGAQTYPAACWYDGDDDDTHDGEVIVNHSGTVRTMCTARSCNTQGTCQSTPQPAASSDECASSCNSDADCSQGRMIETRP